MPKKNIVPDSELEDTTSVSKTTQSDPWEGLDEDLETLGLRQAPLDEAQNRKYPFRTYIDPPVERSLWGRKKR